MPSMKRGRVVEPPRRGKLFRLLWPLTSYLVTNATVTFFAIYFFIFNRTTVTGRHNVGIGRNTLLLSNHQSMIDSFLIGICAFFPKSLWRPHLMPWNPAAVENFYHTSIWAWLSEQWRCIPIREGRRDLGALKRLLTVLPTGVVVMFPEGGRSRDGSVGEGVPGPGFIALKTHPKIVPVAIEGMHEVYPIDQFSPGFFKKIKVSFGEPIDYSDLIEMGRNKDTAQALVDRVMHQVRRQHVEHTGAN
jgi:1-acyl-sn-glycerol-3-phosphate acyltransferase